MWYSVTFTECASKASAEAEAELSKMNENGFNDAVLTSDSDTFLFGARYVIQRQVPMAYFVTFNILDTLYSTTIAQSPSNDKEDFLAYSADAIENVDEVGLTRGGLLLFALLSGEDYLNGAAGCGPVVAHGLVCSGFSDWLLQTYENTDWDDLIPNLLAQWFDDLRDRDIS